MRNRMETKMSRRLLSLALSAAMVLSLLPVFAFAEGSEGLCEHHSAHTPECGYVAAVAGQNCAHVCGDDCFTLTTACTHVHEAACYSDGVLPDEGEDKTADACAHVCTEESGCVTKTNTCVHTAHDEACGYVAAVEGQPCGYVCTECAAEESGEPQPEAACTLTQGCTLPDGHEGPCNAAPAHDCEGTLEPVDGDQGELLWACPVCGALLDAQGKELPAIRSISGTFNGSPADLDANGSLRINIANFPDGTFRAFVNRYDTDSDGSLSAEEVAAVTVMACDSLGIRSLKGIEYFTALTWLSCKNNYLTTLDVSKNTSLTELDCPYNWLTSLDVSGNTALIELDCRQNLLAELNVSKNTALTWLYCGVNQLTKLDVSSNTALTRLDCGANQLTKLDVSKNTALTRLDCGLNQLTKLDVSKNTALTVLSCSENQLTKLDVSKNTALTELGCGANQLTELDVSKNTALTELDCGANQLTELDVSKNTALTRLHCESNRLAALDLTGLSISDIDVSGQTLEAVLTPQNGKLTVDLAGLVGRENLSRVQNLTGGTMDSSGIVTIPVPDPPTGNIQISYQYDTRMQDPQLMPVTLTLMPRVPVIHDGTFNGSPAKLDKNGNLVINADNFPDARFRAFVRQYDTDLDGSLSAEEVGAVTDMRCNHKGIRSLKGIEYFTALTKLYCVNNCLTTLDVSKNTSLTNLSCPQNWLTSLDVSSNTALDLLNCASNRLSSLDVSSNKALTKLYCNLNDLTTLDVSKNTSLTQLDCCMNQLTTLDVSENTGLTTLACDSNQLTSLDLSGNTALETIEIGNQKTTGKYIWRGSAYLLDLSGIVGPDKLSRVSVTPEGAYDSATGMVTLEAPINGAATVKYMYNTGRGSMDVTITATPNPNYLDLTDNHDFDGQTQVLVDGVAYPIETEGGRYVMLPDTGDLLTIYTYKQGSVHEQYPTGMGVYGIDRTDEGAAAEKIDALDDLLQYAGCSIRITGKRGIRMITALTKDNKKALTKEGLARYTLAEYGTVVQWADTLGDNSLTLESGKSNYAYKRGKADPVFANVGDLTQYTNVLVWDSLTDEQLGQDIVMRPYIILKDADGNPVTLYGGCVSRSIGCIAYQNRAVFNPGTAAYKYVWDIIHAVYGDQYDGEYQG